MWLSPLPTHFTRVAHVLHLKSCIDNHLKSTRHFRALSWCCASSELKLKSNDTSPPLLYKPQWWLMFTVGLTGFEITWQTHFSACSRECISQWGLTEEGRPFFLVGGAIPWTEYKGERGLSSSMHLSLCFLSVSSFCYHAFPSMMHSNLRSCPNKPFLAEVFFFLFCWAFWHTNKR